MFQIKQNSDLLKALGLKTARRMKEKPKKRIMRWMSGFMVSSFVLASMPGIARSFDSIENPGPQMNVPMQVSGKFAMRRGNFECAVLGNRITYLEHGSYETKKEKIRIPDRHGIRQIKAIGFSDEFCVIRSDDHFIIAIGPEPLFSGSSNIGNAGVLGYVGSPYYLIPIPQQIREQGMDEFSVHGSRLHVRTSGHIWTVNLTNPNNWSIR